MKPIKMSKYQRGDVDNMLKKFPCFIVRPFFNTVNIGNSSLRFQRLQYMFYLHHKSLSTQLLIHVKKISTRNSKHEQYIANPVEHLWKVNKWCKY